MTTLLSASFLILTLSKYIVQAKVIKDNRNINGGNMDNKDLKCMHFLALSGSQIQFFFCHNLALESIVAFNVDLAFQDH